MKKNLDKIWQFSILFHIFLIINANNSFCPKQCDCDLYKDFNRAQCSNQRLISPDINIPETVEILDLSENAITILDNYCFQELRNLLNLTLSYNSIHTIYLDAFKNLEKLKYIDLSYNRLEYFDERIFEDNLKLSGVNLSGNKFMSLQNKPIFISKSVQFLSLQNSQMTHIYISLFEEIPFLTKLDLSDNLMITLNMSPFVKLNKLKYINLFGNRWLCDKNLDIVVKYLKMRNVNVQLDKCNFKKAKFGQMFERMMIEPTTTTTERPIVNINEIWKNSKDLNNSDREECPKENVYKTCDLLHDCLKNYTILMQQQKSNMTSIACIWKNSINSITFAFCTGLFVGSIITTLIICCTFIICKRLCNYKARKSQLTRRNAFRNRDRQNRIRLQEQPIGVMCRTPERRNATPPASLNRSLSTPERQVSTQSDFATFLSRLFERPTRHQYYRTINENTTNMIRRLSRSSLFLNARSVRQSYLDENRNNHSPDTQQLIDQNTEERQLEELNQTTEVIRPQRPETPPPAYKDVVIN